ncbi:MAG: peptidylprolyl isomerase [Gammaproteobacteria bacterium]|nr:peptidylprolyl isomerase [Gammaproteobacteria bacterium]
MKTNLPKMLALLAMACAAEAQTSPYAATVNGEGIPRTFLQAQVDHLVNQRGLGSGGMTQPGEYKRIQQEVLDQLIVQELLWQEAQRRDFVVSDADVDEQLEKMKSGFDTEMAFQFKIKEGGFTEETYREDIRQQRSAQRMVSEGILPTIEISDEEIQEFYDANIDKMTIPEQVRARHILAALKSKDEEARALAQEKITEVQEALEAGGNFAVLALEHSDGPSATQGGDLGFFERGQMVPPFEEAAFALQPGEISDVVETQFGFHIIKVEERREGRTVPVEEASEKIRPYLTQQKLQTIVETLIEELQATAEIDNAFAN